MRHIKLALTVAALPALGAASEPTVLQPSGGWTIDYAQDSCRLSRDFGTGDQISTMVLERLSPDSSPMMLVSSKLVEAPMGDRLFLASSLPAGKFRAPNGQAGYANAGHVPVVLWSNIMFGSEYSMDGKDTPPLLKPQADAIAHHRDPPPPSPETLAWIRADQESSAAATTSIQVSRPGGKTVVFNTGSMAGPAAMLSKCAVGQLKSWGIDPALDEKIVKRVTAIHPLAWFTSSDYPLQSLRDFKESQMQVRALIGADGRVTKCTPVTRVAHPEFPLKVCQVMTKRARFRPAELADGTKVPSYYIQTISFRVAD